MNRNMRPLARLRADDNVARVKVLGNLAWPIPLAVETEHLHNTEGVSLSHQYLITDIGTATIIRHLGKQLHTMVLSHATLILERLNSEQLEKERIQVHRDLQRSPLKWTGLPQ